MDKKTITGFVLIALILFGFAWWQQPSAEQKAKQRAEFVKDSIAAAKKAEGGCGSGYNSTVLFCIEW